MKKFSILLALFVFCTNTASAKVTAITDWSDSMADRVNTLEPDTVSCAEKCPGYDVTVTYCYNYGEELESCPEDGCGYYHRCVPVK